MADIAFLLLTFFLMTAVIKSDKGLLLLLPPPPLIDQPIAETKERNLFSIQINSQDQYLIEGVRQSEILNMKDEIKRFVLNYGHEKNLLENSTAAIVSLKTDRGTSYAIYTATLDQIQQAYFEIYGERAGITPAKFRSLDQNIPAEKQYMIKHALEFP